MSRPISPLPLQRLSPDPKPKGRWHIRSATDFVVALVLFGMIVVAQGCSGSGGSTAPAPASPSPAPETGELLVGVTDAPGDFAKYEVDVLQVTLERANGDTVATLPLATRIDFAELTEVTEFLTVATVPVGNYESVAVRLDFADADIWVQTEGDDVKATAVDDQGMPLGKMDVRLSLTTSDVIRIRRGVPAAFSLDFDLEASTDVNLDVEPPQVAVDPMLLATPELETDRDHRVRGALSGVDTQGSEFTLRVRPFRHRTGQFGELTVAIDDQTEYEVDGQGYTGADGLEAMAELEESAPVVSNGRITGTGMTADTVLAGTSVPWSDDNVVKGVVTARVGDTLTVRGAHVQFANAPEAYRGEFSILVGDGTTVSAPGVDNALLSSQSISVGQRVVAWGEYVDDVMLDASEGRVRMQMNQLRVTVLAPSPLVVDLHDLNGRLPDAFDFSGTGIDSDHAANPDRYEIDTSILNLDVIEGDLVRVRGLVKEFGAAPEDFVARTVIDVQTDMRAAYLLVGWDGGTGFPFTTIAPDRVDFDLTEARKLLKLRGLPRDLIELLETVALVAPDTGRGVYAVKVRGVGEVHLYRSFADLVDELTGQLDEGRLLHRIGATGQYNTLTHELTTGRASFVFAEPQEAE
jgi:hypothetical protein